MTSETTVGEIVRAVPARSRIFEHLGIDYCCGGKKPLAEACRAKGLDPATVVAMLTALDGVPTTTTLNPDAMSLSELCDHIEEFHHGYLRQELPRLDFMTRKVAAVHGDELKSQRKALQPLRDALKRGPVTLVYSAHDEAHNQAVVLREYLLETKSSSRRPDAQVKGAARPDLHYEQSRT